MDRARMAQGLVMGVGLPKVGSAAPWLGLGTMERKE